MIYKKSDSASYTQEFKKKFLNFCEKAPVLLSYTITPSGVQVIEESSSTIYDFDWDFSIPVKSFIHGIKEVLIQNCYPIIVLVSKESIPLTEEEQLDYASAGVALDSIPMVKIKETRTRFLIDKCIIVKDIFLIKNLETNMMYRYHLKKSSVFFLKKIRSGFLNAEQAGDYFFQNSELLNEVLPIESSVAID